jgi:hypothetical protein
LVLVNVTVMVVVEVPVMQIVLVAFVLYGGMSAVRAVDVSMRFMDFMFGAHRNSPFLSRVLGRWKAGKSLACFGARVILRAVSACAYRLHSPKNIIT